MNNAIKVDRLNDRLNIILLKYKKKRSFFENLRLKRLIRSYPDNNTFEVGLIDYLSDRQLLDYVNSEAIQDSDGNYVYENDLPKYYETTKSGENALQNKLFSSESAKDKNEKWFRIFQIIGICIAAFGGIITLIKFFLSLKFH